ncbi:DUF6498-containing protein [Flavobacterium okayamense]|uniref:Uncharacterized protein n=1 Tax=Flavobacterium okayamense TaxID=2830782 RepID=A0ABM7S4F7_9FLAO|nr:DUF6498-containing protein [Flavobacterium okayamense]BCY28401.1 hypothetical protein KK2020170_12690 [Flavobacterium okayamense]
MNLKELFSLEYKNVWLTALFYIALILIGRLSATEFVIVYALETIIIGVFHAIKMLTITFLSNSMKNEKDSGLGLTLFFLVHYGFFVFIQTTFFFVFLSMGDDRISDGLGMGNFLTVLQFEGVQAALVLMLFSHIFKYWFNFYKNKRYEETNLALFMFQPYVRIIIQQFVAIVPGFFIIFGNGGYAAAIVLILIRTGVDLFLARIKSNEKAFQKAVDFFMKDYKKNDDERLEEEKVIAFLKMVTEE